MTVLRKNRDSSARAKARAQRIDGMIASLRVMAIGAAAEFGVDQQEVLDEVARRIATPPTAPPPPEKQS